MEKIEGARYREVNHREKRVLVIVEPGSVEALWDLPIDDWLVLAFSVRALITFTFTRTSFNSCS